MSRIALNGDNSVEKIKALLGILASGHSVVLLDWRNPSFAAIGMMREADVRCCYIEDFLYLYDDYE